MRSKFGTALALTTVLLTGTAAAAINTQALNSPTESSVGTDSTVLLPVANEVPIAVTDVSVTPDPKIAPNDQPSTSQQGNPASTPSSPAQSNGSTPAASPSPSFVYGNPNPSSGDEDDEDEDNDEVEGNDNDGDDD